MKYILDLFLIITIVVVIPSCGNLEKASAPIRSDLVEVSSTDRKIQSYIPDPKMALHRSSLTFDDLVTSNQLLLTSYGSLKAIEMSDGYHEITSYRCLPLGNGWYFLEYKFRCDGRSLDNECYIKEFIK